MLLKKKDCSLLLNLKFSKGRAVQTTSTDFKHDLEYLMSHLSRVFFIYLNMYQRKCRGRQCVIINF